MKFDWSHYLDLAVELCDQAGSSGHRDANLRSSISRAYYATYHKSCQVLKDKWGLAVSEYSDAHSQIRSEFVKKRQYSIAKRLNCMRIDRNKADYDDVFVDLEVAVETNIKRAKQIISGLHTI